MIKFRSPIPFRGNFIDGRFAPCRPGLTAHVSEDPGDLDHPVGIYFEDPDTVDAAVDAARRAWPRWRSTSWTTRHRILQRFGDGVRRSKPELSRLITREMGKPIWESGPEVDRLSDKAEEGTRQDWRMLEGLTPSARTPDGSRVICRYRPRGVLAVLGPFNLPAYLPHAHILPALIAGNTVVLKPSEWTPFVSQFLMSVWTRCGLPKGVLNMVQGGAAVGRRLVEHPGVDGILFTGSWSVGSAIQKQCGQTLRKIVALEMGGKNAAVVWRDADLKKAVEAVTTGAFQTTGQRCNATSRVIVHRAVTGRFIRAFVERVSRIRIGYGLDSQTWMGPLANLPAQDKLKRMQGRADRDGFETLIQTQPLQPGGKRGYYWSPSVHRWPRDWRRLPAGSEYVQEEVFGPDVAIYEVADLEEAVELNNHTPYGLVSSFFSKSRRHFEKFLSGADSGLVHWNAPTMQSSGRMPFGGTKQSGNARPAGSFSMFYCTVPTVSIERK